ncbi:MAG: hypothetical protein ACOX0N_03790 [Syntrophomonadaceae bacterium]|jgi:hypothetical protein|nr:hypothetical protein [Syntrophomonadaceae bacterium]
MVKGDLSLRDLELLNAYSLLRPSAQRDFLDYMNYLLSRQYRSEVMSAIFNNRILNKLIDDLVRMVDIEGIETEPIRRRVIHIREIYFGVFEQVHARYCEVVENLDSNEVVKDFGRISFDNLLRAIRTEDRKLIKAEVHDFYEQYSSLSRKKDARRLVAI